MKPAPPILRKLFPSLASRLIGSLVVFLALALGAIGLTLLQSWRLEGGAAAINDMGSERMRAYRIGFLLSELARGADTEADAVAVVRLADSFESTLSALKRGDPARPLSLPRSEEITARVRALEARWRDDIRPLIDLAVRSSVERTTALQVLRRRLDPFVGEIDALVGAIERENAAATGLLRTSQFTLVAFAVGGTVGIIFLLYLLVIRPVAALCGGILKLEAEDFSARVPVETRDEFGTLARAFNAMAAHLQRLYATLEDRVRDKTRRLEARNRELATLYAVSTALNEGHGTEALCRMFLHPILTAFDADAGAVRLKHSGDAALSVVVSEGMSDAFLADETCEHAARCECGALAGIRAGTGVMPQATLDRSCVTAGFRTAGVFPIQAGGRILGVFNLYFRDRGEIAEKDRRVLDVLGRHLGTALENERLRSSEKELAVSEERNLIARELHDSIAQSLAFLNLQAQMLDKSLDAGNVDVAREEVSRIRAGVQESYDDVRELLAHFRSRIEAGGLATGLRRALARFAQQSGVAAEYEEEGAYVEPPAEVQGQILHVVQEALSNVRKHAKARHVRLVVRRGPVYEFVVTDDGVGFDTGIVDRNGTDHIGLQIMRERAVRIGGSLHVRSARGAGTEVSLALPVVLERAA